MNARTTFASTSLLKLSCPISFAMEKMATYRLICRDSLKAHTICFACWLVVCLFVYMWSIKEPESLLEQPTNVEETMDSCDGPSDETIESGTQGNYLRLSL